MRRLNVAPADWGVRRSDWLVAGLSVLLALPYTLISNSAPLVATVPAVLVLALPVVVRRHWPVAAFAAMLVVGAVLLWLLPDVTFTIGFGVVLFAVARQGHLFKTAICTSALVAAVFGWAAVLFDGSGVVDLALMLAAAVVIVAATGHLYAVLVGRRLHLAAVAS